MMLRLFLLCRFLLFSFWFFGQSPLLITNDFESEWIGTYASLYEDATAIETIETVRKKLDNDWEKQTAPNIVNGVSSSSFWVRFQIKNTSNEAQSLALVLKTPSLDRVQFFCYKDSVLQNTSMRMGDLQPFSERTIEHRFYIHQIQLPVGEQWEVYCLAGKTVGKTIIPLEVYSMEYWLAKNSLDYLYGGLVMGILSIFICIIALSFFAFQKKYLLFLFLEYLFVLGHLMSNSGFGFQFIWSDQFYFQQVASRFFIGLLVLFKSLVIIYFFETKKYPKIQKSLYATVCLSASVILLILLSLAFPKVLDVKTVNIAVYLTFCNFCVFILIAIGLFCLYKRTKKQTVLLYLFPSLIHISVYLFALIMYYFKIEMNEYNIQMIAFPSYFFEAIVISILIIMEQKSTNQKNESLQLDLARKQTEALQNLLQGQSVERKRLSRELHDGLSIRLALFKNTLSKLGKNTKELEQDLPKLLSEIDGVHQDLRHFSHALNPIVLQDFGLKKAIQNLIYTIELNHEHVDVDFYYDKVSFDKTIETHFYHITQELLNNTLKHAEADEIKIAFKKQKNSVYFSYFDNGIGFNKEKVQSQGIGLKNIESRVGLMKGNLDIETVQPKGMRYHIAVQV